MSAPITWNGNFAKLLKDQLKLGDTAFILTGISNPTSITVNAPKGSLYLDVNAGSLYVKQDSGSSMNWSPVLTGASQTTLNGTVGTAVCSQPFTSASYKKILMRLDGYTDNATPALNVFTFPSPFVKSPVVSGEGAVIGVTTVTTTTVTISGAVTVSGWLFVEGY